MPTSSAVGHPTMHSSPGRHRGPACTPQDGRAGPSPLMTRPWAELGFPVGLGLLAAICACVGGMCRGPRTAGRSRTDSVVTVLVCTCLWHGARSPGPLQ